MSKFPQLVTFIGTLEIDTEGLDWDLAQQAVAQALLAEKAGIPTRRFIA